MQTKLNVKLLEHTPNPERVITTAAKLCYSDSNIEDLLEKQTEESIQKFLNTLISLSHESPMEHVSFTFAVEGVSRALTHQLVRHRIASYCLSGDTVVGYDNKSKGLTIEELYNKSEQYQQMIKLRSIDEKTRELLLNNVVSVVKSGKKELFELLTEDGYKIKATAEHRFFTDNGWKRLKELNVNDLVYTNGTECYKDKEWLKKKFHEENLSTTQIGELCGVTAGCIKKWIARFNIGKPRGYHSIGKEPPNKGKTKYNYEPLKRTSEKMKNNTNYRKMFGEDNPQWKGGINNKNISNSYSRKLAKNLKSDIKCCEKCSNKENLEVHHIDGNCKNNDINNLIKLCSECHKYYHLKINNQTYTNKGLETKGTVNLMKVVKLSKIISIKSIGIDETYDIEMKAPYHNFIANGFVVHNSQQSQRYVKLNQFSYIIPPAIEKNEQAKQLYIKKMEDDQKVYDDIVKMLCDDYAQEYLNTTQYYKNGLQAESLSPYELLTLLSKQPEVELKGIKSKVRNIEKKAIEDARYVFPNACETKIVLTMNFRTLINFIQHRSCERAQWEIREMAIEMIRILKPIMPTLSKLLAPKCCTSKCPEGKMSCGLMNEMKIYFANL